MFTRASGRKRGAFTLLEMAVVIVIVALLTAIVVPKMSRGSAGAADSSLTQNLSVFRNALELYQTEHGAYPSNSSGALFMNQLTQYTDSAGNAQPSSDPTHIYGPYLKSIPPLPVGTHRGLSNVTVAGPAGSGDFGWYYDGATVWANDPATDTDLSGTPYNTY